MPHTQTITANTVHETLRALRYAKPLSEDLLLRLGSVTRIVDRGRADIERLGREWALRQLLAELTWEGIARKLDGLSPRLPTTLSRRRETDLLKRAFETSCPDCEALCLLFCHYLGTSQLQMIEASRIVGVSERTLARRLDRGYVLLADALLHAEGEANGEADGKWVAVGDGAASAETSVRPARLWKKRRSLPPGRGHGHRTGADPEDAASIRYWSDRITAWSAPPHRLDRSFVPLDLLLDRGPRASTGIQPAETTRFEQLSALLTEIDDPALVLLGAPGAGKSTLLQQLDLQLATDGLAGRGDALGFLVQLSRYRPETPGEPPPAPRVWLARRWTVRFPSMPSLETLLARGRMVLLLDGLNEMPTQGQGDQRNKLRLWKALIDDLAGSGNRLVFSCRRLDYTVPLSTTARRVPQVHVTPLADAQMQKMLERYSGDRAAELWARIAHSPLFESLRRPFFLRIVAELDRHPELPHGRAGLLSSFVRLAIWREIERDNPLFRPDGLLGERDHWRLIHAKRWTPPDDVPSQGPLVRRLAKLAYTMQEQRAERATEPAFIDRASALAVLGGGAETTLQAAEAMDLLVEDPDTGRVGFRHPLFQEYFAARCLVRKPEPQRAARPWREGEAGPPLAELLDDLMPAEALPPPTTTGWEETTRMAAELSADPHPLIHGLLEHNLALAGECAATAEVQSRLSDPFVAEVRHRLLMRSRESQADLRDRIACGLALGRLGDPRLRRRTGPEGGYLLPDLVALPGGRYPMGENAPIEVFGHAVETRSPAHVVALDPFALAAHPVTNAEWAAFIDCGGYENARWWVTPAARAWQRGIGTAEGLRADRRWWRRLFAQSPAILDSAVRDGALDASAERRWRDLVSMSDHDFEAMLLERHADRRCTEPRFWKDVRFNNPTQPVVGISWYEAVAYCNWLSAQTGRTFRLPTEAEWEAAARGKAGRGWPFGDRLDPLKANVIATRLRRTSPIGVFPEGDSPEGVTDLCGNVTEWLSSAYGPSEPDARAAFGYPYDREDGRETLTLGPKIDRCCRGASHALCFDEGRASVRMMGPPADRVSYLGMRLASSA